MDSYILFYVILCKLVSRIVFFIKQKLKFEIDMPRNKCKKIYIHTQKFCVMKDLKIELKKTKVLNF